MRNLFKAAIIATAVSLSSVALATGTVTYRVAYGETFLGIAIKHGMTYSQLAELNPKVDPNALKAGEVLNVHYVTSTPPKPKAGSAKAVVVESKPKATATVKPVEGIAITTFSDGKISNTKPAGSPVTNFNIMDGGNTSYNGTFSSTYIEPITGRDIEYMHSNPGRVSHTNYQRVANNVEKVYINGNPVYVIRTID